MAASQRDTSQRLAPSRTASHRPQHTTTQVTFCYLQKKRTAEAYRVTPQNGRRRFKMQRGARTARVSRITSNRNSVVKPQPLHPRPPRRLRRHCRAERRQAGRRPQHHSGRKSGYRSNQRGPTRSSESSRSRLQCPCTEPSRSYSTGR